MSRLSIARGRPAPPFARLLAPALCLLLAACGHHEGDKPKLQGAPAAAASSASAKGAHFQLMSGSARERNDRSQLELVFNAKLAAAYLFMQTEPAEGAEKQAALVACGVGAPAEAAQPDDVTEVQEEEAAQ